MLPPRQRHCVGCLPHELLFVGIADNSDVMDGANWEVLQRSKLAASYGVVS